MGARDLLDELDAAGFSVTADGNKLLVRPFSRLSEQHRAELREHKAEVLALLSEPARPYRLSAADADTAHADPWNDDVIERFKTRVRRLLALRFNPQDAEDLAERLHLRDVHADYRVLCIECSRLAGSAATGWRCRNARAARVARDLPAELVTMAQDCPGFSTATRSTTT